MSTQLGQQVRRRPVLWGAAGVLVLALAVFVASLVASAQPQSLDQRTITVAQQLQCPVCNGESVAASPATIAQQMRVAIRAKLQHGESEQQVLNDFVQSYGEGILESPPKQGFDLLIWAAPVVALLAGLVAVGAAAREWRPARNTTPDQDNPERAPLTAEERERLTAQLRQELALEEGLSLFQPAEGA